MRYLIHEQKESRSISYNCFLVMKTQRCRSVSGVWFTECWNELYTADHKLKEQALSSLYQNQVLRS